MAAGKVNVSRRGDLSKRPFDRCAGVELNSVGGFNSEAKNRSRVPSDGKDGVGLKYEVRRQLRDVGDGVGISPPEKKRKFSPIRSDGEELSKEAYLADDHEPGQIDEEDFSNAPNIFTSRWAYDDDHDEDMRTEKEKVGAFSKQEESKGRCSSPESGLTQDGSGNRLSEFDGSFKGDLDNDTYMENESREEGDYISDESDMDYGDGSKATVSGQGRNMLQASRSVYEYERLGKINEGSYGIVYKAMDKKTGEMVALKKLKMGDEREGFPLHFLREINTLMSLNHPSIVNMREVVVDDGGDVFGSIYMVMDYVEHDLKALMQARKQRFSQSEVKCLMLQLLEGVQYLHDNWVLHRDLKTSNLLLNNKGELKVCDFGMACQYATPSKPYTSVVVTLWYRAPELLLKAKEYSTAVDMWSVGCIMAELLTGKPLFDGKTELEQLNMIFRTLGTPNDKIWPGCSQLPGVKANFVHQQYNVLHTKFPRASFTGSPTLSDSGLDLLSRLLTYDPAKRISAEEALSHRWFQEVPLPQTKDFMPTFPVAKTSLAR